MSTLRYLLITGKLAEPALRREWATLAPHLSIEAQIITLPISVVALATTPWIANHLPPLDPDSFDRVLIPGLCQGELDVLEQKLNRPVDRGPKDFRDLAEHFGRARSAPGDYGRHDIEILAEINHVGQLTTDQICEQAQKLYADGADLIDLGCDPGITCPHLHDTVQALRQLGMRVSIDSFNSQEVQVALSAGAELVLSVKSTNVKEARDWNAEVVAIPDDPATLAGLDETIDQLIKWNVPFRMDPILEPIGFGFAPSLGRYLETRRRFPDHEMMMGIGNLTELTDVDSAGVNVMLIGFCQELGIRSVLTTQVINWCQSSVREIDRARRLMYHCVTNRVLPKHLETDLIMLRDPKVKPLGEEALHQMSEQIRDRNFRIFAEQGLIHVMNNTSYWKGTDPFEIMDEILKSVDLDSSHTFYLGYEMSKARTALTLGKNYVQDQALRWGLLSLEEESFLEKKRKARTTRSE